MAGPFGGPMQLAGEDCCEGEQEVVCSPCNLPLSDLGFEHTYTPDASLFCPGTANTTTGTLAYLGLIDVTIGGSTEQKHVWEACLYGERGGTSCPDGIRCDTYLHIVLTCKPGGADASAIYYIHFCAEQECDDASGDPNELGPGTLKPGYSCDPLDMTFVRTAGFGTEVYRTRIYA